MAFGCLDIAKVFVPPTGGFYAGLLVFRRFGPYPHHLNASGHPPELYFVLGFIGGFVLIVGLWKGLMVLLMRADSQVEDDSRRVPPDDDGGEHET